jgi:hypothetical protein
VVALESLGGAGGEVAGRRALSDGRQHRLRALGDKQGLFAEVEPLESIAFEAIAHEGLQRAEHGGHELRVAGTRVRRAGVVEEHAALAMDEEDLFHSEKQIVAQDNFGEGMLRTPRFESPAQALQRGSARLFGSGSR